MKKTKKKSTSKKTKKRIGLFGGTFNPVHSAHVALAKWLVQHEKLDQLYVIPTLQNPLKAKPVGAKPQDRAKMLKEAFGKASSKILIDESEIKSKKISYSFQTVKRYRTRFKEAELFFVLGADAFSEFDRWRDFESILKNCHLLVLSRPGFEQPRLLEELPHGIRVFVSHGSRGDFVLLSGKHILFLKQDEYSVSSTLVRARTARGESVEGIVPPTVAKYIYKKEIYKGLKGERDYEELTRFCGEILFMHKGIGVKGIDLRKVQTVSDFAVVCSGTSTRHTSSLGKHIVEQVKKVYGLIPLSVEGLNEGRWVVVDFGSLIVHIFYDFVRSQYEIEKLWMDGRDLKLEDHPRPGLS